MSKLWESSMRQLAYSLQRTGNPRCEAEAMEIHERLDVRALRQRADTLEADGNGDLILDRNNPDHCEWFEGDGDEMMVNCWYCDERIADGEQFGKPICSECLDTAKEIRVIAPPPKDDESKALRLQLTLAMAMIAHD